MEGINTPFVIDEHTAIVMTDPQNDFLSENGLGWGAFGENIQKNGTVENLRRIFEVAAAKGMLVFISPHYYYKHDHQWLFEGPIEKLMHDTGMFERRGQLTGEGFEGSGADWLELYKPYIDGGTNIIVTAPHKLYGPENNDLILQLRKRGVNKVVVCGMSGNLCAESHLRELQERGFEAAVVFDARPLPSSPDWMPIRQRSSTSPCWRRRSTRPTSSWQRCSNGERNLVPAAGRGGDEKGYIRLDP